MMKLTPENFSLITGTNKIYSDSLMELFSKFSAQLKYSQAKQVIYQPSADLKGVALLIACLALDINVVIVPPHYPSHVIVKLCEQFNIQYILNCDLYSIEL